MCKLERMYDKTKLRLVLPVDQVQIRGRILKALRQAGVKLKRGCAPQEPAASSGKKRQPSIGAWPPLGKRARPRCTCIGCRKSCVRGRTCACVRMMRSCACAMSALVIRTGGGSKGKAYLSTTRARSPCPAKRILTTDIHGVGSVRDASSILGRARAPTLQRGLGPRREFRLRVQDRPP